MRFFVLSAASVTLVCVASFLRRCASSQMSRSTLFSPYLLKGERKREDEKRNVRRRDEQNGMEYMENICVKYMAYIEEHARGSDVEEREKRREDINRGKI